jgi:hypothetical protein
MPEIQRAVPVLQVVNVEASMRWYGDRFGFSPEAFPPTPPHSFAMLRRDGAEIMLQCADAPRSARTSNGHADPELLWSVYLRIAGTAILELARAVERKTPLLRGPERMFYGLVEFELCDPDGYRVCVSGEAPADAVVPQRVESDHE